MSCCLVICNFKFRWILRKFFHGTFRRISIYIWESGILKFLHSFYSRGLQAGEHLLKHTGIEVIRTAGGKLVQVRGAVLNQKQARELGVDYILTDLHYQQKNILYEPLSPTVQRLVKSSNIKVIFELLNVLAKNFTISFKLLIIWNLIHFRHLISVLQKLKFRYYLVTLRRKMDILCRTRVMINRVESIIVCFIGVETVSTVYWYHQRVMSLLLYLYYWKKLTCDVSAVTIITSTYRYM